MRLPGTEHWDDQIDQAIAFDMALVFGPGSIERRFPHYGERPMRSDAIFVLAHAAEIALAAGRWEEARNQCVQLVCLAAEKFKTDARTSVSPLTEMEKALAITVGAITSEAHATSEGSVITFSACDHWLHPLKCEITIDLAGSPVAHSLHVANRLIAATTAARSFEFVRSTLEFAWHPSAAALQSRVRQSDEFVIGLACEALEKHSRTEELDGRQLRVFAPFSEAPTGETISNLGRSALHRMIQNYAARLEALQSDEDHWNELMPKGDIIDWSLLALATAVARTGTISDVLSGYLERGNGNYESMSPSFADQVGAFIAELAFHFSLPN